MTVRPITCAVCGEHLVAQARGRVRIYCSDACRMRLQRRRGSGLPDDRFVPVESPNASVSVPRSSSDAQVERAILEARAVMFALLRLGVEARPELAWRCQRLGEALKEALDDTFGRITQ